MLSTRKTQGWSADHAKIYSLRSAKALPSAGNAGLVGGPCENLLPALRESLVKCEKCEADRQTVRKSAPCAPRKPCQVQKMRGWSGVST